MVDLDESRLEGGQAFWCHCNYYSTDGKAAEALIKLTAGRGVDTAIEAVGIPATFELCEQIVTLEDTLPISACMAKRSTFTLRSCGIATFDHNAARGYRHNPNAVQNGVIKKIDPKVLITHRFKLDKILDAYETLAMPKRQRPSK